MYYYKFNLQLYKKKIIQYPLDWSGTRACLNKNITYPQIIRDTSSIGRYNLFGRLLNDKKKMIYDGGWHFSFVRSPEFIKKKIQSYGHSEYNTDEINNLNNIKRSIKNHTDIFNRDILLIPKKIDNSFPKYIVENQKKLFKFIET
jgi:beta-1,4-mannosyl-glycoprotein beta-1,4-N-acetylglucosaminyltransferase